MLKLIESVHVNKVHGMKTGKLLDIENDQLVRGYLFMNSNVLER